MSSGWVPAGPDSSGPAGHRSDVLDAGGLAAAEVDAQLLRGPEDLVVDQVQQLQDVDVAHRDRLGEGLPGTAVEQPRLAGLLDHPVAVAVRDRRAQEADDLVLLGAVEHRGRGPGAR